MSLAAPLGLLAAAFALPLALWYLLRARRPRVDVASTFLWRDDEGSVTAALPWQRFRGDPTFWLVLLAILVAAVALARPALPTRTTLGDHTILLLDTSASMLADEDGPTRLELARRAADELVADVGPGQLVSVVEAGTRARVLLSASGDAGAVRRALRAPDLQEADSDLTDAFTLAASLQRPGQETVVHLLTDGEVPPAHAAAAPPGLRVTAVGASRPNLAIVRLQAVVGSGRRTSVFAEVRNLGETPAEARLELHVGGTEVGGQQLSLPPRGGDTVLTEVVLPPGEGDRAVLTATLAPDGPDALALDDTAAVVVAGSEQPVALVAGPGNVYATEALAAAGARVRTAATVPDDLTGIDLLVVDRVAGPTEPVVPTLYVAPTRAAEGVRQGAPVEQPAITLQAAGAPLLADVDLSAVRVVRARPVTAPALTTLVAGPDGALVVAGSVGGRPVVHVGFDLLQSSLPLDVAWPVLVSNVLTSLAGDEAAAPVPVGTDLALPPPPGATALELAPPGGTAIRLDAAAPTARLDRVGVWGVRWLGDAVASADATATVAVQALPSESDLARPAPAGPDGAVDGQPVTAVDGVRLVGSGLLAAVLVVLLVEWAWAHGLRLPRLRWPGRRRGARAGGTPPRGDAAGPAPSPARPGEPSTPARPPLPPPPPAPPPGPPRREVDA